MLISLPITPLRGVICGGDRGVRPQHTLRWVLPWLLGSLLLPLFGTAQLHAAEQCAVESDCGGELSITRPSDYRPYEGEVEVLEKEGAALFADTRLGASGRACSNCHNPLGAFRESFASPYPHRVGVAVSAYGLERVHADEMVQLCVTGPLAGRLLPWDSRELAALTAHVLRLQSKFVQRRQAAESQGIRP